MLEKSLEKNKNRGIKNTLNLLMPLSLGFQKNNTMLEFFKNNIWLITFIIWGLPLSYYRSNFRKIVYQTNDWKINIKPLFIKEIKALFGTYVFRKYFVYKSEKLLSILSACLFNFIFIVSILW